MEIGADRLQGNFKPFWRIQLRLLVYGRPCKEIVLQAAWKPGWVVFMFIL